MAEKICTLLLINVQLDGKERGRLNIHWTYMYSEHEGEARAEAEVKRRKGDTDVKETETWHLQWQSSQGIEDNWREDLWYLIGSKEEEEGAERRIVMKMLASASCEEEKDGERPSKNAYGREQKQGPGHKSPLSRSSQIL